jgi:hypothetical protein
LCMWVAKGKLEICDIMLNVVVMDL